MIRRGLRLVPWWWWIVGALALIGAADDRWARPMGVVGAVAVVIVVGKLTTRRRPAATADWREAELRAAEWLRSAGCRGVELTRAGADGGIDIVTDTWAVQVKHRSARTGRPAVQQIVGAALTVDRQAAVVSTSGFTAPAIEYADDHDVALIEIDALGRVRRVNGSARAIGARRQRWR